ncbi:hypothetical protein [Sphingobium yanoikuyae]|uniref:hypothetical protein n=1 Tax=Sphingobium yanoikuyae TaxID=13690 RepID=UPI00345E8AFC
MAQKKWSEFAAGSALTGTEGIPGISAGVNQRWTAAQIATYVAGTMATALAGKQPLDDDLTAIAAVTTTPFGRGMLTMADDAASRTALGLGGAATLNVGTAAGTVAAGDDARITGALPTEATTIKLSLATASGFLIDRIPSTNSSAAQMFGTRIARGTLSAPTAALNGDHVFVQRSQFYDGAAYNLSSRWRQILKPATPSATDAGSIQIFETCAAGSASISELYRWDYDVGLSMYGAANVVIDNNRIFRNRGYVTTSLPTPVVGGTIYGSNLGGGPGLLFATATAWLHASDGGYLGIATDAGATFTFTYLSGAKTTHLTAPITANRTVTLTAGAPAGARARFTRAVASTGAFNWAIGALKNLAAGTWCEIESDGTNWQLIQYSTL